MTQDKQPITREKEREIKRVKERELTRKPPSVVFVKRNEQNKRMMQFIIIQKTRLSIFASFFFFSLLFFFLFNNKENEKWFRLLLIVILNASRLWLISHRIDDNNEFLSINRNDRVISGYQNRAVYYAKTNLYFRRYQEQVFIVKSLNVYLRFRSDRFLLFSAFLFCINQLFYRTICLFFLFFFFVHRHAYCWWMLSFRTTDWTMSRG